MNTTHPLFAVIDPFWGEPQAVGKTLAHQPTDAIAKALVLSDLSLYSGARTHCVPLVPGEWQHLERHGFKCREVNVVLGGKATQNPVGWIVKAPEHLGGSLDLASFADTPEQAVRRAFHDGTTAVWANTARDNDVSVMTHLVSQGFAILPIAEIQIVG